jgi:hypothetical protein
MFQRKRDILDRRLVHAGLLRHCDPDAPLRAPGFPRHYGLFDFYVHVNLQQNAPFEALRDRLAQTPVMNNE